MNQTPGRVCKRRLGRRLNHTEGSPSLRRGCLVGGDRQIKDCDSVAALRVPRLPGREAASTKPLGCGAVDHANA